MPRRELGGALGHGPGQLVEVERVADDHVAAGRPRDVQPEVPRLGDAEGEPVVVRVGLADQDLEALELDRSVPLALAPQRRCLRAACYARRGLRLKVAQAERAELRNRG